MTKVKSTKRALLSSVLALFLCVAMLVGTTFAWFTDSVTSANNIIKSGNLDVELDYWNGTEWKTVGDADDVLTNELWEPGTTEVAYLRLTNAGSLALKYQLGVNIAKETTGKNVDNQTLKLSDYIYFDVVDDQQPEFADRDEAMSHATEETLISAGYAKQGTINAGDAPVYLAMVVYMPTTVGNEANHNGKKIPQINLGINLLATQTEAELDSFGSDYDKEAWVKGMKVYNEEDLQAALSAGETTVTLMNDIVVTEPIEVGAPAATYATRAAVPTQTVNLNGYSIDAAYAEGSTTNHVYAFTNYGALVIKNGEINARGIYNYGTLTLQSGTINAIDGNGGYAVRNYAGASFVMKGGKIATTLEDDHQVANGGYDATTLRVDAGATAEISGGIIENICDFTCAIDNYGDVTISNGTFTSIHSTIANHGTMTINGGDFTCNGVEGNTQHVIWAAAGTTTINGGTFDGKDTYNGFNVDASAGATVEIYDGTFMPVHSGSLYGDGAITAYGGNFFDDVTARAATDYIARPNANGTYDVVTLVAEVGGVQYYTMEEAVAAWTNGKTLTLINNATIKETIVLKSTEHHILDLSTYTLTAKGVNAIEIIACGTGDSERFAITIKADATNPGGINAANKSIIYYDYSKGGISGNDRPIIKIEGGVFTGSTSSFGTGGIYAKGSAARKCVTFNISGGTFNCSIVGTGKSKMLISGGTFHYSVGSQGDSTCYRLISGGTFKSFGFMTADAANKFGIGSALSNYNIGVYVDRDGYLVVGGPVITEAGDRFEAVASNYSKWSDYLKYSSAATYGLYYEDADMAIAKHGAANVTVFN